MNKHLYALCVFLLALSAVASVVQQSVYFFLERQIFILDSFLGWFSFASLIVLANALLLLKYYNFKGYRGAFITGVISALASFGQMVTIFIILTTRQFQEYYTLVSMVNVGASMIHAAMLVFSKSNERPFLRYAGFFSFLLGVVMLLILLAFGLPSVNPDVKVFAQKAAQWILLLTFVGPVLLAKNYVEEAKILAAGNGTPDLSEPPNWMSAIKIIAFLGTLSFGVVLMKHGYMSFYYTGQNLKETLALKMLSENGVFKNSRGDSLQYLLIKPKPYDPKKKYPLVVCLPYGRFEGAALAQILTDTVNRKKYPAFMFVPYCPEGAGWGGIPNYPTIDTLVFEAISSLDRDQTIDTTRRYITGISRGGYGTWNFITKRPDMFAAAIPVCGAGDPRLAGNIAGVSVWAFHGAEDNNVPVSGSRDMIEAMKQAGEDPRYTEYPDQAHNIWYSVSKTPDLLEWLFSQHKTNVSP